MRRLILLGLVGGIGSGKSHVAGLMAQLGADVIDADRIAHDVLRAPEIERAVVAEFGAQVLADHARRPDDDSAINPSGPIDRSRLGALVFQDKGRLARLNAIVHPVVQARIEERITELAAQPGPPQIVLLDVPLLLEGPLRARCDKILFVHATRATRLERVVKNRGWDPSELERREKNQKPLDEKEAAADYKVTNEGPEETILAHLQAIRDSLLGCPPARPGATLS